MYHYANILASQVLSEVRIVHDHVLQAIAAHTSQLEPDPDDSPYPQAKVVKSTNLDAVQLKILCVII